MHDFVLKEKELQLIRQIHILLQRRFGRVSLVHFQALMMKNYKDYNKQIATPDNGNVQSHNKEKSKSNSTVSANLSN